jgi:hypothetical protein
LRREDIKHVDAPLKRTDAQAHGYRDGLDLARDVAANWTEAYAGHSGRLVLAIPNGDTRVAVVASRSIRQRLYAVAKPHARSEYVNGRGIEAR